MRSFSKFALTAVAATVLMLGAWWAGDGWVRDQRVFAYQCGYMDGAAHQSAPAMSTPRSGTCDAYLGRTR